jgi:hypothetical protein
MDALIDNNKDFQRRFILFPRLLISLPYPIIFVDHEIIFVSALCSPADLAVVGAHEASSDISSEALRTHARSQ